MSAAEEAFAVSLVVLAAQYPYVALAVVAMLLIIIACLLPLIWKALRAVFTRLVRFFSPAY